jgi:hypothetical protein
VEGRAGAFVVHRSIKIDQSARRWCGAAIARSAKNVLQPYNT